MTYLLALIAGLVGGAIGLALGVAAGALLAEVLGITSFEGAAGYFAVFTGGPIGGLLGLVLGPMLVLRRKGHRGFAAVGGRLALVFTGVIGLGAVGVGAFWMMRPFVNANGPAPELVFEIRLPQGVAPPGLKASAIELQTSKNRMPATLEKVGLEGGRAVISGRVDLYFRVWQRMLVLTLPDKTDILFDLSLGLTPRHTKALGAWQRATYVGEPGKEEARRTTPADQYDIRYRIEWAGEE
jgi:MFS family permease